MISLDACRSQWLGNIRGDLLAGLVVALALIPEAIAYSIIAGVDTKLSFYASFSIAVIIAITGGGRPGMISAATAATAVLMVTLVRDHGLQDLLAATVLAGLLQIGAGVLRLGFIMRYVSKSVMIGFVNALAILIFMAQLPELDPREVIWLTYALDAAGLASIYLLPLLTTAIPSPLVTMVVLTALTFALGLDVRTLGDMGALPDTLLAFLIPDIPLNFETLMIILPYSVAVAVLGLLESLMTQKIVDDLTDTKSNRSQECIGQGVTNTATGIIGGMAGCAMIGQSIINVKSGGRGRLSSFAAGVYLLFMVVVLGHLASIIPMAALVAIMIMVSIGTFSWSSIKALSVHPRSSSIVMIPTVVTVVYTHSPFFAELDITVVTVGSKTPEIRTGLADAKALLKAEGIDAETRIVPGQPENELGRMVEEEGFGMVVMGAYGHSRIRSLVIGSTTTEMVRSCKVPVLRMR